jgi:hypothetical protein
MLAMPYRVYRLPNAREAIANANMCLSAVINCANGFLLKLKMSRLRIRKHSRVGLKDIVEIRSNIVSKLDRVLVPGSADLPDCQCGAEMHLAKSKLCENSRDAEIRIYQCPACAHELRLMVWTERPDLTWPLVSGA